MTPAPLFLLLHAGEGTAEPGLALGAVLAGGAGSRLGGAKATAELAGRPLISYPLAAFAAAGIEAVVVAKQETELPDFAAAGWAGEGAAVPAPRLIVEPDEPRHPLAGILAALRAAGERPLVVLACDMPLASPALLAALAAAPEPLVVPNPGGLLEPLQARYSAALLPPLEEALADAGAAARDASPPSPRACSARRSWPASAPSTASSSTSTTPPTSPAPRPCSPPERIPTSCHLLPRAGRGYPAPMSGFVSRGFGGHRRTPDDVAARLPPGQYLERGFPVLTAGPTPEVETARWTLKIDGMVDRELEWTWEEFNRLPAEEVPCDIHCVTKWSKLGTSFRGVSVDTLFEAARTAGRLRHRLLLRRLHDQPRGRGPDRRPRLGRHRARGRAAAARARRAGPAAGPAPLLLEERQVARRAAGHGPRRARVLGGQRLPQPRRPLARAALLDGLSWTG